MRLASRSEAKPGFNPLNRDTKFLPSTWPGPDDEPCGGRKATDGSQLAGLGSWERRKSQETHFTFARPRLCLGSLVGLFELLLEPVDVVLHLPNKPQMQASTKVFAGTCWIREDWYSCSFLSKACDSLHAILAAPEWLCGCEAEQRAH